MPKQKIYKFTEQELVERDENLLANFDYWALNNGEICKTNRLDFNIGMAKIFLIDWKKEKGK